MSGGDSPGHSSWVTATGFGTAFGLLFAVVQIFVTAVGTAFGGVASWPYVSLQYQRYLDDDGTKGVEFFIENDGSGPAIIKSAKISYAGREFKTFSEALDPQVLRAIKAGDVSFRRRNALAGTVLPPQTKIHPFVRVYGPGYEDVLNVWKSTRKSAFEVCYCSSLSISWIGRAASWMTGMPVCWIANRDHQQIAAPGGECPENRFED
jgi:hypothetical protein